VKRAILPIGLAIVLLVVAKLLNPQIEATGLIIAAALGLGVGAAVNNVIFKKKKQEEE
jgi:uncharacterized membrane protein YgaE (UPF0421/DUF939 family)